MRSQCNFLPQPSVVLPLFSGFLLKVLYLFFVIAPNGTLFSLNLILTVKLAVCPSLPFLHAWTELVSFHVLQGTELQELHLIPFCWIWICHVSSIELSLSLGRKHWHTNNTEVWMWCFTFYNQWLIYQQTLLIVKYKPKKRDWRWKTIIKCYLFEYSRLLIKELCNVLCTASLELKGQILRQSSESHYYVSISKE